MAEADKEPPNFVFGMLWAILAGATTCLGMVFIPLLNSGIVTEAKSFAASLAFATGVMIWLAFMGILDGEGLEFWEAHYRKHGHSHDGEILDMAEMRTWIAAFFFIGMAATVAMEMFVDCAFGDVGHGHSHGPTQIDEHRHGHGEHGHGREQAASVPGQEHMHVPLHIEVEEPAKTDADSRIHKVSIVAMLALAVHSFPEGLLVFFTSSEGTFLFALGIALHHIPGGAAIAVSTYKATKSYMRAFIGTLVAACALPLGALFAWLLVIVGGLEEVADWVYGAMFAASAGTLVAIALSGMLPEALRQASNTFCLLWVALGFLVMEASIIIIEATGGHAHEH